MAKMKHWVSMMTTLGVGLGLSGCGYSDIRDVYRLQETTAPGGTPFTQALSDEYRTQANDEAKVEAEWDDAGWFARRGLQSAAGEIVLPVDPATLTSWHWTVPPPERLTVLLNARAQLIAVLDGGARERVPAQAAHVQALYDCWVEEEAENDLTDSCGPDFRKLIATFQVAETTTPEQTGYQVFFDWDKSNIDVAAAAVIRSASGNVQQGRTIRIGVTGHTDSSGPESYNQPLSERRAAAVKAELVRDGVPENEIEVVGVGEAGQLVPTADDVREAKNRRAVVVLQK